MVLLRQAAAPEVQAAADASMLRRRALPESRRSGDPVVRGRTIWCDKFGAFTAVDHVSFEVRRGEIFGLLGPNGAGKTTTFRMLCGLLTASGGTLHVAGVDLRQARASARQRIGYVAQKFSLYGQLTVLENLDFFASAYGLRGDRKTRAHRLGHDASSSWRRSQICRAAIAGRIQAAAGDGGGPAARAGDSLPGRADQRRRPAGPPRILAADHRAGRAGRHRDRHHALHGGGRILRPVAIMDAGRVLAQGTPAEIRRRAHAEPGRTPTMEDAFIAIVEQGRGEAKKPETPPIERAARPGPQRPRHRGWSTLASLWGTTTALHTT